MNSNNLTKSICKASECTACGACENICPKKCIERHYNEDASWYMVINKNECINCGLCEKVCPNIEKVELNTTYRAYAAWATDKEIHSLSASGGIASSLYNYAAENGMYFAGVSMNDEYEAHFHLTDSQNDIKNFRNSKYTFSHMDDLYPQIVDVLKAGKDVLFIGLPCQVAAVKKYVGNKKTNGKMITVDLVCHGTPPARYFNEHVNNMSKRFGTKARRSEFRDANFGTQKYVLALYDDKVEGSAFYKKYVDEDDLYQIGYHKALIYRDCCYECRYARRDRVGDITLGDYHGLGNLTPYTYEKEEVSCVLINTDTGERVLQTLIEKHFLVAHERPVLEPLTYEHQLNYPSIAPKEREQFLIRYKAMQDYDLAAEIAFKGLVRKNKVLRILHIKQIKLAIIHVVPASVKEFIKAIKRKMGN